MTAYLHDGIAFDLDGDFADVTGVVWSWTGDWSPAAEPMLRTDAPVMALPLPDVHHYHGPLIPIGRKRATTVGAAFAATRDAGYVETDDEFAARIGGL